MVSPTRAVVGVLLMVAVAVVLSYGMLQAGVPQWLRMTITWGMGWTSGKYIFMWADIGEDDD